MRQIKFRIWNKTKNKYIYSDEFDGEQTLNLYFFFKFIENIKCCGDEFLQLEQFTDIQDKNEDDIYQGDAVKSKYQNNSFCIDNLLEFGHWFNEYVCDGNLLEIVAGKHETPELLESK